MRPSYREKSREQARLEKMKDLELERQLQQQEIQSEEISTKQAAFITIATALPLNILLYFMLK